MLLDAGTVWKRLAEYYEDLLNVEDDGVVDRVAVGGDVRMPVFI